MRALVLAALAALPQAASAQMSEQVRFEPGNFGAMVSGSVTGNEYFDYRLDAGAGQEMFAELTVTESDGDGTVYFNILPPGSADEAIYIGSMDSRVYQMGSDEDAGKTSAYRIDLSIQ